MATACLPVRPPLHVDALLLADDGLTIVASSDATDAPRPLCGERSDRIHSREARTLADRPWATLAVRLRVQVRNRLSILCPPSSVIL